MPASKKIKPKKLTTKVGEIMTDAHANVSFTLDEHDPNRVINWTAHAHEGEHNENDQFGMIIGEDLMHEIGTTVDYCMGIIANDGVTRLIRSANTGRHDLQLTREKYYHSDTLKMALYHQEEALDNTSIPVETKKCHKRLNT